MILSVTLTGTSGSRKINVIENIGKFGFPGVSIEFAQVIISVVRDGGLPSLWPNVGKVGLVPRHSGGTQLVYGYND